MRECPPRFCPLLPGRPILKGSFSSICASSTAASPPSSRLAARRSRSICVAGRCGRVSSMLMSILTKHKSGRERRTGMGRTPARERLRRPTARVGAKRISRPALPLGLACAYAHGTVAMRTHIDSYWPHAHIGWRVFRTLRETWAGRIALQASSLCPLDHFMGEVGIALADEVADWGGVLGMVTTGLG